MDSSRKPPLQDIVSKPSRQPRVRKEIIKEQEGSYASHTPNTIDQPAYSRDMRTNHPLTPLSRNGYKRKMPLVSLFVGAAGALAIGFFFFSIIFSRADVLLSVKEIQTTVNGVFEIPPFQNGSIDALTYRVLTLSEDFTKEIPATGEEQVSERASGRLVVYNNFNTSPQLLIKNTRFETPEGLIYRISESVTVPGQKRGSDGKMMPGSIEVTVHADEPGDRYNIGLTDFTIPGFKGTSRFEGFFARSKTSMTGGFVGKRKTAPASEISLAREILRREASQKLRARSEAEVPEGFQILQTGTYEEFEELPLQSGDNDSAVSVVLRASLYAPIVPVNLLAKTIAGSVVPSYDANEEVTIGEKSALSYIRTDSDPFDPRSGTDLTLTISGDIAIVWVLNPEALVSDLAGKSVEAVPTILGGYPAVERVRNISIRPFWKDTFPENPEDIRLTLSSSLDVQQQP